MFSKGDQLKIKLANLKFSEIGDGRLFFVFGDYANSIELGAQYVQRHQKTIKGKKTTPASMYLPEMRFLLQVAAEVWAVGKTKVSAVPCNLTSAKVQVRKDLKGRQEQRDFEKSRQKERPTVPLDLHELPG